MPSLTAEPFPYCYSPLEPSTLVAYIIIYNNCCALLSYTFTFCHRVVGHCSINWNLQLRMARDKALVCARGQFCMCLRMVYAGPSPYCTPHGQEPFVDCTARSSTNQALFINHLQQLDKLLRIALYPLSMSYKLADKHEHVGK